MRVSTTHQVNCDHKGAVYQYKRLREYWQYRCNECGQMLLSKHPPVDNRLPDVESCKHTNAVFVGVEDRRGACGKVRPHQVWRCNDCGAEWAARTNMTTNL
jgi:DNA-directed RNA polymerase subunit RPC12/RpoP